MSRSKKRAYDSRSRASQARETKERILKAGKKLFKKRGLEKTTINMIAEEADVAAPTIYAVFKSKEGILRELVNATLFGSDYQSLVEEIEQTTDPAMTLKIAAKISRSIYDADKNVFDLRRSSSAFSPAIRKIELANERQRYDRQKVVVLCLYNSKVLPKGTNIQAARDILWALTDREIYRKLVQERQWPPEVYEEWLSQTLIQTLIADS